MLRGVVEAAVQTPQILTDVLDVLKQFVRYGGVFMAAWGGVTLASALREQEGTAITKGIWTLVGGAMIFAVSFLFNLA